MGVVFHNRTNLNIPIPFETYLHIIADDGVIGVFDFIGFHNEILIG